MRKYADLHLAPSIREPRDTRAIGELVSELGFKLAAVSLPAQTESFTREAVGADFERFGIDVVSRIDLAPRSRHELLGQLRKCRRQFEVVAVRCDNQAVGLVAARDGRVDLIYFDPARPNMRLRKPLAELCSNALEIQVGRHATQLRARPVLAKLRDEVNIARSAGLNVVLTSGARRPVELRGPLDIAAVGCSLGLTPADSEAAVSTNPVTIVRANRQKLSPTHVELGVKLVREAT